MRWDEQRVSRDFDERILTMNNKLQRDVRIRYVGEKFSKRIHKYKVDAMNAACNVRTAFLIFALCTLRKIEKLKGIYLEIYFL